jgi:hypothetical protein
MPITIPDSVTTAVVNCLTTTIYATVAVSSMDQITQLILAIAATSNSTDWTHLPSLVLYIMATTLFGGLVYVLLKLALVANHILQESDENPLSGRVAAIYNVEMPNGSKIQHIQLMSECDKTLLEIAKRVFIAIPKLKNEGEEKPKEEEAAPNTAATPNTEASTETTAKPDSCNNKPSHEISGPADAIPTEPPAPEFGNTTCRPFKRPNQIDFNA